MLGVESCAKPKVPLADLLKHLNTDAALSDPEFLDVLSMEKWVANRDSANVLCYLRPPQWGAITMGSPCTCNIVTCNGFPESESRSVDELIAEIRDSDKPIDVLFVPADQYDDIKTRVADVSSNTHVVAACVSRDRSDAKQMRGDGKLAITHRELQANAISNAMFTYLLDEQLTQRRQEASATS